MKIKIEIMYQIYSLEKYITKTAFQNLSWKLHLWLKNPFLY